MQENKALEVLHGNMRHHQLNAGNFELLLYRQLLIFVFFSEVRLAPWLGELTFGSEHGKDRNQAPLTAQAQVMHQLHVLPCAHHASPLSLRLPHTSSPSLWLPIFLLWRRSSCWEMPISPHGMNSARQLNIVLRARLLRSNPLPYLCTSPYHPQLSCSGMLVALLFSGDLQPFQGLFCSPLLTFIKKDKSFLHLPEGCYGSSEEICKN